VFQEWDDVLGDPNGASVEQFQPSAAFETGSTTLCQFSETVGMFGDAADVAELVTDLDNAASAEGLAPPTGSDTQPDPSDVNEYQTFSDTVDLSQIPGATASDCSISYLESQASTVAYYKGGTALERRNPQVMLDAFFSIPNWLLQVLAGVAAFAVTIAVSTAFTLAFTAALGPPGAVVGPVIGGCIGGFAGAWVSNLIQGKGQPSLVATAVSCVTAAIGSVVAAKLVTPMVNAITAWRTAGATLLEVEMANLGVSSATSSAGETSFATAFTHFSGELSP